MVDPRNKPGQGDKEQGGQDTGTERERERGGQGGSINEPERQANPRRGQQETDPSRTGTERTTEDDPGRQNAG